MIKSKRQGVFAYVVAIATTLWLAGCSSGVRTAYDLHGKRGSLNPGGNYVVRKGDTLFGIAWRYGLDPDELARWNRIADKNRIFAGQSLRTRPPSGIKRTKVVVPRISSRGLSGWRWPTRGKATSAYSPSAPGKQGLGIRGRRRQAVVAANGGEVAYTGTGLSGFGRMVIVRHPGKVLSAYGYLDNVKVHEGQKVRVGQEIGTMGIGPDNTAMLHFEVRKQGQPVNPYSYIGTVARY